MGHIIACGEEKYHISQVVRKPFFGVSDPVRHKAGCCTTSEDGLRLEILRDCT